MSQIFRKCVTLSRNMLCGWQISYSQNLGLSKFRWSPSPSKLKEPHEVISEDFPFFHGPSNMCTKVFFSLPNPYVSSCARLSPCPNEKNPTQIGHHILAQIVRKKQSQGPLHRVINHMHHHYIRKWPRNSYRWYPSNTTTNPKAPKICRMATHGAKPLQMWHNMMPEQIQTQTKHLQSIHSSTSFTYKTRFSPSSKGTLKATPLT